jgi:hypothetical protein
MLPWQEKMKEMILEEGKIKINMIQERDTRELAKMKQKEK